MWPFSDSNPEVTVENNVSTHNVAGYAIDTIFVVVAILIYIAWRWRRNARRLKEVEDAARRLR